tara:strand:+ start:174 stop:746 length:573 start_codon:yes stop_codon:yes gene_type:complete
MSEAKSTRPFVLYTNHDKLVSTRVCPGSQLCLDLVGNRADVLVQRVDALISAGVVLPTWLNGTPCLVDRATARAFKGTAAVARARELSQSQASTAATPRAVGGGEKERRALPPNQGAPPLDSTPMGVVTGSGRQHDNDGSSGGLEDAFQTISTDMSASASDGESSKITSGELEKYMQRREMTGQAQPAMG